MMIRNPNRQVIENMPRTIVPGTDHRSGAFHVQSINRRSLSALSAYYLGLDETGRVDRFHAPLSNAAIASYMNAIDLSRATLIGAVDIASGRLIGVAELHAGEDPVTAEGVIHVDTDQRSNLVGDQLMELLMDAAAMQGFERVSFDYRPDDHKTRAILRRAGATMNPMTGFAVVSWCVDMSRAA